MLQGALIAVGACLALYVALVGVLLVLGRRTDARAIAGFVPDCVVLLRRLIRDPRVARRRKLLLLVLVGYLALPIDLIPDLIPVVGQVDDALMLAVVLRAVLRGAGPQLVHEHWPGPPASLRLVLRLAGAAP